MTAAHGLRKVGTASTRRANHAGLWFACAAVGLAHNAGKSCGKHSAGECSGRMNRAPTSRFGTLRLLDAESRKCVGQNTIAFDSAERYSLYHDIANPFSRCGQTSADRAGERSDAGRLGGGAVPGG